MPLAGFDDFRRAAQSRLPRVLFDYIDGGSFDERTASENAGALARLRLRQRVLRDVSEFALGASLFGQQLSMPVILSPVGLAGMYARRGEAQAARAARAAGVPFSLSTVSVCSIEEVSSAAGTAPWFQLYMMKDRAFMETLIARADAAGCPVMLFTVDLPIAGWRRRDARNAMIPVTAAQRVRQVLDGLTHPAWLLDVIGMGQPHVLGNLTAAAPDLASLSDYWAWLGPNTDASITWDDIAWIRARWRRPLVIKGVLEPDDAREAVRLGADGVVVSNHGGRQLDSVKPTIEALRPVVDAVGTDAAVLIDGGVRSGLDVLKCLASGASACLIGRAWAFALAAQGQRGVATMLEQIRYELRVGLALTGCNDVAALGPDVIA